MTIGVQKLAIKNYRSLENVQVDATNMNVRFGPHGAGKSTFLDALWFVRDCAIRGVDLASSERSHGIGVLWDKAEPGSHISIQIETEQAIYQVLFGFSSGRIESFVGEMLTSKVDNQVLIERLVGSDKARFYHSRLDQFAQIELREPHKLALRRYLDFVENAYVAAEVDRLLDYTRYYHARSGNLYKLKNYGSESDAFTRLSYRYDNLWSVLRNLRDEREIGDERYETIMQFMQKSFPTFDKLYLEQQGANSVYGSFIETDHREPVKASGVSDGHLQMLAHLVALFSEGNRQSLILFDEPELSLHPYALAVFAEAVKAAAIDWNKQVFIATHSPVLISQFDPENIIAAEIGVEGQTVMQRVSDMAGIQDLLDEYAVGSLYMAELIAPQSKLEVA
ncbi:MAG: AAA family ATPase [Caldilineaceae bacterium]